MGDGLHVLRGHGTENDFVVVPDRDGSLGALRPALVRALCDRRAGLGGDGTLRVAPTTAVEDLAHLAGDAAWAMDYTNADGTYAEMCGNGVRVVARFLVDAGWAEPGALGVATRDGVKTCVLGREGDVEVDMGVPVVRGDAPRVGLGGAVYEAVAISTGNPHAVVPVGDLDGLDLTVPPVLDPADFPEGANVEAVLGDGPGRIRMRVHERGSGETRSCGTGVCAAAVASTVWWPPARHGLVASGDDAWQVRVEVPGGVLHVREDREGRVHLRGPAVLVAEAHVRQPWLDAVPDDDEAPQTPPVDTGVHPELQEVPA